MTCALWFVFSILMARVLFFVFLTLMNCALCFVFVTLGTLRSDNGDVHEKVTEK